MTGNSSFDQKNQSVKTQTNIKHADKVIIQPSDSVLPLPQQIPSPPFDFKGREEEIKSLLDQFDQGATITGLRGMGGIGKTALALVLADRLKDSFPDGQLFLNMLGTSKNPLMPEEAMAHIIRSYLGFDVKLPADKNGLGGHYRSVLSGKRALILLDNAADRVQVEPLIPPAGSALLITSRNKFALAGLMELDLNVLPLGNAKDLLLSICGRICEHAEELANLCGCLPIALRNAASVLREMPNIGVARYVERLAESRVHLDEVEASFNQSYQLLAPEMQKLWSLLSVFPADFDLFGVAAVWEMENDAAEEALGKLVKRSLVDFLRDTTGKGGRYRLHDLARDFAGTRLEDATLEPARLRHAGHYQKLLWAANELSLQGKDSLEMGLMLFDSNLMNINAGQKWASENKFKSNEIAEICSNFAWAGPILNLRLHLLTYIEWLNEALIAVRETKNKEAEGGHLGNLGIAYFHLGDPRKAIEYYDGALKISCEIGDSQGEINSLGNLGNAYCHLGDPYKSIEYYNQALEISCEIGDRRSEGNHLCNLGLVYFHLGDPHKAIKYYNEALEISREIRDWQGEVNSLGNLGLAYSHLGNPHKAIECYDQALKISCEIGDQRGKSGDLCNLGLAYFHLGDPHKAIRYNDEALNISREIGERRDEGNLLGNLGLAYIHLGDLRKAIECCDHALKISREIEDMRGEANHLSCLGNAYLNFGDSYKAIEYYDHALKISRKTGNLQGEGDSLGSLGDAYFRLGDLRKAIEYCDHALKISRDIGDRRGEANHLGSLGNAYFSLEDPHKAIEYYDEALKISREIGDRRGEGIHLFNISIYYRSLGQRERAICLAKSALEIFEQIDSPQAETVRKALTEWKS
jgi:tetratricopeptide (TPR) repeat protein